MRPERATPAAPNSRREHARREGEVWAELTWINDRYRQPQHPADKAAAWARRRLRKAKLPTVPGRYAPDGDGGLVLIKPTRGAATPAPDLHAGHPWIRPLHDALLHLGRGYTRTSPEVLAAELLRERETLQAAVEDGDADNAAAMGCRIGAMHVLGQDREMAAALAAKRVEGRKAAERALRYDRKELSTWVQFDRRREAEGEHNASQRARDAHAAFGVNPETYRRRVREHRRSEKKARSRRDDLCSPKKAP